MLAHNLASGLAASGAKAEPTPSTLPPTIFSTPFERLFVSPAYPHLRTALLSTLDHKTKLALRLVSRALCYTVDAAFLRHIAIAAAGIRTAGEGGDLIPRADFMEHHALRSLPQIVDVPLAGEERARDILPLLSPSLLRAERSTAITDDLESPTLLDDLEIPTVTLWYDHTPYNWRDEAATLLPLPQTARLVVNVAWCWPIYFYRCPPILRHAEGLYELVIHFHHIPEAQFAKKRAYDSNHMMIDLAFGPPKLESLPVLDMFAEDLVHALHHQPGLEITVVGLEEWVRTAAELSKVSESFEEYTEKTATAMRAHDQAHGWEGCRGVKFVTVDEYTQLLGPRFEMEAMLDFDLEREEWEDEAGLEYMMGGTGLGAAV